MGRRRRRRPHEDEMNPGGIDRSVYVDEEGKVVNVRKIGASDEGVLYTMQISVSCALQMQIKDNMCLARHVTP